MNRTRGFTLIEMVIVMAIGAILAALAVPAYSDYVRRGRAAGAAAVLKDVRQRMEQRYADDRTYAQPAGGCSIADFADPDSGFALACTAGAGGQSYVWTATGAGVAAGIAYSIDEAGIERTTALPAAWRAGLTLPVTRFVLKAGG